MNWHQLEGRTRGTKHLDGRVGPYRVGGIIFMPCLAIAKPLRQHAPLGTTANARDTTRPNKYPSLAIKLASGNPTAWQAAAAAWNDHLQDTVPRHANGCFFCRHVIASSLAIGAPPACRPAAARPAAAFELSARKSAATIGSAQRGSLELQWVGRSIGHASGTAAEQAEAIQPSRAEVLTSRVAQATCRT